VAELKTTDLKRALVAAGLEVFRVRDEEVHLAERQNVQLMEAGIRVKSGTAPRISVVVRAQRNDSPTVSEAVLYALIRERSEPLVLAGYREEQAASREIRSVSDDHVVDVWYEIVWVRQTTSIEDAVNEARRAIAIDRYVVSMS